jgi:RNA polymerase sigma factor (sigma-70 family)
MDQVLAILKPHMEGLASPYADPMRPLQSTADLLQESCLRAWQKIDTFQGGETDEDTFAMFRVWIGQIVRRLGMNQRRALKATRRSPEDRKVVPLKVTRPMETTRKHRSDPPARQPSPSTRVRGVERSRGIQEAVAKLSDETDARIVKMHFIEKLTLREIAARIEMDFKEVRRRYRAAMRSLEKDLETWI